MIGWLALHPVRRSYHCANPPQGGGCLCCAELARRDSRVQEECIDTGHLLRWHGP